jgi:hypothetical protein
MAWSKMANLRSLLRPLRAFLRASKYFLEVEECHPLDYEALRRDWFYVFPANHSKTKTLKFTTVHRCD